MHDNLRDSSGSNDASVHFGEALYAVEEQDTYQSKLETKFERGMYDVSYGEDSIPSTNIIDCSNIHLVSQKSLPIVPSFCVDIGAPRSVAGKAAMDQILGSLKRKFIPSATSSRYFRFGDVVVKSLGLVEVALDTPQNAPNIMVLMDIVSVNIPALLGLDVLDNESLYADNVTNRLVRRNVISRTSDGLEFEDTWHVPIFRHDGHLYTKMSFPTSTFYTTTQLRRFHKQFAHPSAAKLYNLLRRAGLQAVDSDTL